MTRNGALNNLSAILLSIFAVTSCMQAEKVSLDTSGTEGLVLGGLSIDLGLFGGVGPTYPSGTLDISFGTNGKAVYAPPAKTVNDSIKSLAVLADDTIIVSGPCTISGPAPSACVLKYRSDGTLDSSFGTSGIVNLSLSSGTCNSNWSDPRALRIQSDGKIVIAGTEGSCPALARLNANGAMDTSFGSGGITNLAVNSVGSNTVATGLAMTANGSFVLPVAFGGTPNGVALVSSAGAFVRYAPTNLTNINGLYSAIVQNTGRIVVGGYGNSSYPQHHLNAFVSDLTSIDTSFGTNGIATVSVSTSPILFSIYQQVDGKILTCGQGNNMFTVARFSSEGIIDASFGVLGKYAGLPSVSSSSCFGITQQADGKIVAVGTNYSAPPTKLVIVRLLSNGVRDPDFGTDGVAEFDLGYTNMQMAWAVGIDSRGRIIAAGSGDNINGAADFLMIRVWP